MHYELDCLIFASGFEVGTDYARRSGFETIGRDGVTLSEHWADGMRTLHGIHVHGFPNLFIVGRCQGANLISNITHNLVEAGTTIAAGRRGARRAGRRGRGHRAEAEQAWVELLETRTGVVHRDAGLHARLLQQRGPEPGPRGNWLSGYPEGPSAYFEYIDRWRTSGDFEGLEFR